MSDILNELTAILDERKNASPTESYVSSLYHKGLDTILKKIGEEATETVIAAKDGNHAQTVYEMADLWFHCLVLLSHQNISADEVLSELERRLGVSGHEEKASRETE